MLIGFDAFSLGSQTNIIFPVRCLDSTLDNICFSSSSEHHELRRPNETITSRAVNEQSQLDVVTSLRACRSVCSHRVVRDRRSAAGV